MLKIDLFTDPAYSARLCDGCGTGFVEGPPVAIRSSGAGVLILLLCQACSTVAATEIVEELNKAAENPAYCTHCGQPEGTTEVCQWVTSTPNEEHDFERTEASR